MNQGTIKITPPQDLAERIRAHFKAGEVFTYDALNAVGEFTVHQIRDIANNLDRCFYDLMGVKSICQEYFKRGHDDGYYFIIND